MGWRLVHAVDTELERVLGARPQDRAACVPVLERAVQLCRTDPAAAGVWVEAELLDELVDCYAAVGRVDDAIAAMHRALEVGWSGEPDGRCRIAELLMRDGRVAEAAPIWAQVRADTPDDVWLYNSAGREYADFGDHEEALVWLTRGVQIAMATRDPEQLLDQLTGMRAESLTALGRPADDLQDRAAAFLADPPPRPARTWPAPMLSPRSSRVSGAPSLTGVRDGLPTRPGRTVDWSGVGSVVPSAHVPERSPATAAGPMVVALAWFPASEYQQALTRWPELATEGAAKGGKDHAAYNKALQSTLQQYADADDTGALRLCIAPIMIELFLAWCRDNDRDPASDRVGYSAELARRGDPSLIGWPPARNQRCWCGSGRKYKQCCGSARP